MSCVRIRRCMSHERRRRRRDLRRRVPGHRSRADRPAWSGCGECRQNRRRRRSGPVHLCLPRRGRVRSARDARPDSAVSVSVPVVMLPTSRRSGSALLAATRRIAARLPGLADSSGDFRRARVTTRRSVGRRAPYSRRRGLPMWPRRCSAAPRRMAWHGRGMAVLGPLHPNDPGQCSAGP